MSLNITERHKILRISSVDKNNAFDSNTNFTTVINSGVFNEGIKRMSIQSVEIPNYFFNITSLNNSLKIIDQSAPLTTYTISITTGYYNVNQLITELIAKINAVLPTADVSSITLNPIDNVLTFNFTSDVKMVLIGSTIADVIGLSQETIIFTNLIIMDNPVNLVGVTSAYIFCRELAQSNAVEGNKILPIMCSCPLGAFGDISIKYYEETEKYLIDYEPFETRRNATSINIQIRDIRNNLLLLPSNFHVVIIVKIYY